MTVLHKDWYQHYKNLYLASLKDGESRGVYPSVKLIAKSFGVGLKAVQTARQIENWDHQIEVEISAEEERSNAIAEYKKNIESHRTLGYLSNVSVAGVATAQFRSQSRLQKILDDRLTIIESLMSGTAIDREEMHLGDGDLNEYVKVTANLMATSSRAIASTIGALAKTNAIAAESLNLQEVVLLVKQLELDLGDS